VAHQKVKTNLKRKDIRFLRKIEKFLMEEPARFSMKYGLVPVDPTCDMLRIPACGTAVCIGGAGYVVATGINLMNHQGIIKGWDQLMDGIAERTHIDVRQPFYQKLFFIAGMHDRGPGAVWPPFYTGMYKACKTPLERACVGVARIEHFIATDGKE
jgi:hypothetical protein